MILANCQGFAKENTDKCSLSLFHPNICSLLKKINDLENLVQLEKIDFDIIAISESRLIKQDKLPQTNISLTNYHYE